MKQYQIWANVLGRWSIQTSTDSIGILELDMMFLIRQDNGPDSVKIIDTKKGDITSEVQDPRRV